MEAEPFLGNLKVQSKFPFSVVKIYTLISHSPVFLTWKCAGWRSLDQKNASNPLILKPPTFPNSTISCIKQFYDRTNRTLLPTTYFICPLLLIMQFLRYCLLFYAEEYKKRQAFSASLYKLSEIIFSTFKNQ